MDLKDSYLQENQFEGWIEDGIVEHEFLLKYDFIHFTLNIN